MSLFAAPQADRAKPSSVVEDALVNHDAVEDLAETLQQLLQDLEQNLPDGVVAVLHGTPLGHPLHPILVHLPLGGWMIAGMLDFYPGPKSEATERAADLALTLGTVGAVATIATGWTDWAGTRGEARRTGLIHGALNETAFLLNVGSVLARRRQRRGLGKLLSGAALGLALAGGFLGGQLVYRHGLGVGQTLDHPQG
ncbi:DUF2231 domain-containing protein [Deinococcus aerophilus]|uniref:DUF2231 domain-containing protein n=1 Tax=Deinococcus aerophilus TaxID=522488 RepID=A0ABQ2GMQ8_9DEIO|nr:DUF2231 domain-containing protein [Deinococcus aerophilus]GGM03931.1 hypothetical protein GCM10010841_10360 [Deinococcus aerophilus]